MSTLNPSRTMVLGTACIALLVTLALPLRADPTTGSGWQRKAELVSQSGGTVVLDGVRWGFRDNDLGKAIFKRTTVRTDQVRDVYYYSQPFNVTGLATALNRFQAHGLLVFVMKNPDSVLGEDGSRDIAIAVSVEARRETPDYSALKGIQKFYKIHYQMQTEKDRLQWGLTIWKERIQRFRLKIDESQKRRLLEIAIEESVADRDEWYHAITNSCIAGACRMMNRVLPENQKLTIWTIPGVWYNLKVGIPSRTPRYLIRRGVAEQEDDFEVNQPIIEYPLEHGTYRIVMKDLPEVVTADDVAHVREGLADAGSDVTQVPVTRALQPPPADPLDPPADLEETADLLGVGDAVREDRALLEPLKAMTDTDVMLH